MSERRLDRICCNDTWLSSWIEIKCCTLARNHSDHYPLMMSLKKNDVPHASSFQFMKMWTEHKDCFDIIANAWKISVVGCPMHILNQKLKHLKCILKYWNKEHFGEVHDKVQVVEEAVSAIQGQIANIGYSDELFAQEKIVQCQLSHALHLQEIF